MRWLCDICVQIGSISETPEIGEHPPFNRPRPTPCLQDAFSWSCVDGCLAIKWQTTVMRGIIFNNFTLFYNRHNHALSFRHRSCCTSKQLSRFLRYFPGLNGGSRTRDNILHTIWILDMYSSTNRIPNTCCNPIFSYFLYKYAYFSVWCTCMSSKRLPWAGASNCLVN